MNNSDSLRASILTQALGDLRNRLIRLHKTLLLVERRSYERMNGRIASPARFFELAVSDPWFAWLRPVSELIVRIDEVLAEEGGAQENEADITLRKAGGLLTPDEMGAEFQRRYYEALQMEPPVVMAHAEAVRIIREATAKLKE